MYKLLSIVFLSSLMLGLVVADTPAPVTQTEAGKKSLERIRQLGGLALELAQNDQHLDVSYLQSDNKFSDEHLAVLPGLAGERCPPWPPAVPHLAARARAEQDVVIRRVR